MPKDTPHILIVDDDDRLRSLLKKFLREQGFMVSAVADAAEARRKLAWFSFDAMVLDVMMPGESGLDLLASLDVRQRPPVLMLSAMGEAEDRIRGLEIGADDYLGKPFEPKELVLRLQAIVRRQRQGKTQDKSVSFGEFVFDPATGQLRKGSDNIALTTNESAMLRLLCTHIGTPVSREELSKVMPGAGGERSVDVQVTRLRKKIEESEGKPLYLQTVRGAGYVLYGVPAGGKGAAV